ncbi:MAG TPA: hypothetical protein VEJ39_08800 [Candidatus Acidoferrales bacterium]|nr:hypothetical protein [Candidatus Acidoferrales bacterium]
MLMLRLVLGISACGLLALIAMVLYDIWLAYELDRMNRHASIVLPANRPEGRAAKDGAFDRVGGQGTRH